MPATTFAVFLHGVDSSGVDTQSTCIFPFLKSDEEGWVLSLIALFEFTVYLIFVVRLQRSLSVVVCSSFSSAFVQDLQHHACTFMFISSFQLHVFVGWDFRLQFQAFTFLLWVAGVVRLGCLSITTQRMCIAYLHNAVAVTSALICFFVKVLRSPRRLD
jgi:hypothetical protein